MFLLILCVTGFSQTVTTIPQSHGWTQIRSTVDGFFTTTVNMEFPIAKYTGNVTLWFDPDTTGAANPAATSYSTISLQLYNADSGEWGTYYNNSEGALLDTVSRYLMNVDAASADVYMPLDLFPQQFSWASKGRIIWALTAGHKIKGNVYIGGTQQ